MNIFQKYSLPKISGFSTKLEEEFRADFYNQSLNNIRFGFLLCALLYSIFGILDVWIIPETKIYAFIIRFLVVVPLCLLIISLSYSVYFKLFHQFIISTGVVIAGLGIVVMIALAKPHELGFKLYYSGLILVIIWNYGFLRQRFKFALISALIITACYQLVAIFMQHLTAHAFMHEYKLIFISNNFFFISANIIGAVISYTNEKLHRHNFWTRKKIEEENETITQFSEMLFEIKEEVITQNSEIQKQKEELSSKNQILESQHLTIYKQLQELKQLNYSKDQFLSIIAHDLRNPFTSIMSNTEALILFLERNNQLKAIEKSKIILNATVLANELLDSLLKWAETQNSNTNIHLHEIQLNPLVNSVLALAEFSSAAKQISIQNLIPTNIKVQADKDILEFIIRNLVYNAIEYTPENGKILIESTQTEGFIHISIQDTGTGIPKHIQEKLFRLDAKVTTKGTQGEAGTGMGLILCKEFIEKLGGKIWFETDANLGTKFIFSLPF